MATSTLEYLFAPLTGEDAQPTAVYHYTSPRGLLGMVTTGHIWATDIRYLNDSQEYTYAGERIRDALAALLQDTAMEGDWPCIEEFMRAQDILNAFRVYVASFSEYDDRLSQWRAYCPSSGGFAVGFPSEELMRSTDCLLLPCIYDWALQETLIRRMIDYVLAHYRRVHPDPSNKQQMSVYGAEFASAHLYLAAILKDPGFEEEKEWRLITRSRPDGTPVLRFREGRSGVVPYVELSLRNGEALIPLTGVRIGPNPHTALAKGAVESLLGVHHVQCSTVTPSSIPYRAW